MKPMITRSIRLSKDDLDSLEKLGVDVSELVRDTISKVVKTKTCPTCGHKKGEAYENKKK